MDGKFLVLSPWLCMDTLEKQPTPTVPWCLFASAETDWLPDEGLPRKLGLGDRSTAVMQRLTQKGNKLQTFWVMTLETMMFHPERSEFLTQQDSAITVVLETNINVNPSQSLVQTLCDAFVTLTVVRHYFLFSV